MRVSAARDTSYIAHHPDCNWRATRTTLTRWKEARIAAGERLPAYIEPENGDPGEFFSYTGEHRDNWGQWLYFDHLAATYSSDAFDWRAPTAVNLADDSPSSGKPKITSVHLLEEREYWLDANDGTLKLKLNNGADSGQETGGIGVADGVTGFEIRGVFKNGAVRSKITTLADWENLRAIRVTVTHATTENRRTVNRTLSADFFPRNVISK